MNKVTRADVLVVGGGPAGIGAAIAAARTGADTLLLERYGFFGGVGAYGCGMPINQMRPAGIPRGAVHELLIDRLLAYGEEAVRISDHALVCNVEYLKVAVMDALDQVECRYWLHSRVVDARVTQECISGVVLATKTGFVEIAAGIVIDATGDADIAAYAGAETMKGREPDGFLSPTTLNMIITNIDVPAAREFQRHGGLKRLLDEARERYPLLPESMGLERAPFPIQNALVLNHSGTKLRGVLDGTRVEDLTEAERYSRHQAIQIVQALREFGGQAFAKVQLAATGPQVGVRETRRVKGLYTLTEDDALSGRRFGDTIAWRSGMLDIGFTRYEPMKVHDVPYGALIPEKMDGLLTAGRCISATHVAASAGKSMGNCVATGHAAGLAAALAVAQGCMPRDLDVRTLQARLRADNVDLTWSPPPTYNAR
ncbi:MAG: FAD-dependent oxidoreductase [Anaerolineae bacterium]|nr:FAD-dependent oxidoreductase [Anaerolineae bacterium]